jgi:hypothetical protein
MTKIPKRLMREFAKVCGLECDTPHTWWRDEVMFDFDDWQTVIELATEWCEKNRMALYFQCESKLWWVEIPSDPVCIGHNTNLPRAIMEAVVAANHETRQAISEA